jgi:hypothetical protein
MLPRMPGGHGRRCPQWRDVWTQGFRECQVATRLTSTHGTGGGGRWLPPVAMVGVLLFAHVWALSKGRQAFSWSVLLLELLFLGYLSRPLRIFARRVITSESGIEIVFYAGLRLHLAWQDIRQVRDFSARTFEGRMRLIRLIPRGLGKRVIITDRIDRFQDLYGQIRVKATQADYRRTPVISDRLLYWYWR